MTERVVQFGARVDQVGILCEPASDAKKDGAPAILMWNVGVNHRVGPFRVYVDLSRRLTRAGFTAFRFDGSGRGDSEVRRDASSDQDREERDLEEAMDMLTKRTGIRAFVLVGFCSSVDVAHRVSVKSPRVVGVAHIEGYSYRTQGFKRRQPLRLLVKERWVRLLRARESKLRARLTGRSAPSPIAAEPVFQRDYPAWPQFRAEIAALSARNVAMLFLYSGGDTDFNYRDQFWEMFATPELDRSKVEVSHHRAADHTFYGVAARTKMLERVVRWVESRFGAQPSAT